MIQKETIEIKTILKGTKSINFFGVDHSDFESFPIGYLIIDSIGTPIRIVESKFETEFIRLPDNSFKYDSTIKFITGKTSIQTFNYEISLDQQGIARQKFIEINKKNYGKDNVYWADFSDFSTNDLYANVSLIKSYNTLNTLSVINSVEGEPVFRESPTGVVFGKIEALQKINDENGNKIRIPLANVPIAIFNTTDEFPDISSVDENGNRIILNLKENSLKEQYFNDDTYAFAQDFLTSTETLKKIPDKYRYSALTNDKGEFVIYDVPIGTQTFMVEVDLLKQGMTKDEVSLNFFPYPTTSNPNVDNVPHFYFKQFSINVVPSWSDFQSGYTQLNVTIPLDLRKWVTYIFPPAAFAENEKLEVTVSKNANRKFKIQIRDMTGKDSTGQLYPIKTLTLSKIQSDTDRDEGSQYIWFNEFAENRRQVEYSEFGCYVLKLPANLYDPNGYKTDENGIPTINKGVWLSAYQLKCFIDSTICSRATGGYKDSNNEKFWSHFDMNFFPNSTDPNVSGLGIFPYEQPWSISYPEPYKIPAKPVQERFVWGDVRTFQSPYILEEPAYSDGDLVGLPVTVDSGELVGGFGLQGKNGTWFPNQIAYVATKNYMYKYESGVRFNETYTNGYEPFWNQSDVGPYVAPHEPLAGMSSVVNGEKYQRVECGYGYFMKHIDWPRVYRVEWAADVYIESDGNSIGISPPSQYANFNSLGSWRHSVFNIDDQNYAFAFNQRVNGKVNNNTIDIYRIVNSGLDNIIVPVNFVIKTSVNLSFGGHADMCHDLTIQNTGTIDVELVNNFNTTLSVPGISQPVQIGAVFILTPGNTFTLNSNPSLNHDTNLLEFEVEGTNWSFPGNDGFNTTTNKYELANYRITIQAGFKSNNHPVDISNSNGKFDSNNKRILDFSDVNGLSAKVVPDQLYINSISAGGTSGYNIQGISTFNLPPDNDHRLVNIIIESTPGAAQG